MATASTRRNETETLEFQRLPGEEDIRVSNVVAISEEEKIRAISTAGRSIVLAAVGRPDGDTVTVIGTGPFTVFFLKELWDKAKAAAGVLKGGQTCTTTTTVNIGSDGKVTGFTVTTVCTA